MRVIHPRDLRSVSKKRRRSSHNGRLFATGLVLIIVGYAGYVVAARDPEQPGGQRSAQTASQDTTQTIQKPPRKTGKLKEFTGPQFKDLALSIRYPNTQQFDDPPGITGIKAADDRIRRIAEERGYRLTSIPVSSIEKINEPRLEGDDLLQPLAAIAWRDLKDSAARDGIKLAIISGYRSPDYQRSLFMSRLIARGVTVAQVAEGSADAAVIANLGVTAVPGYSRHHTGYTIDLWCEDGSAKFVVSSCYRWISAENYKKAKLGGWIPSYPDGTEKQGPEPEPWEYIWVGKDLLTD
jgi:LAS superfamily LD-carboxypeptidase LdcB